MVNKMKLGNKVLVIGGAGFIGSNLVESLKKTGHLITVLDNLSSGSRKNFISGVEYQIGNAININQILCNKSFDTIFHFGEYSRVEQSFSDIDMCFKNNISSFPEILNFSKKNNAKLIYSASSTVFQSDNKDGLSLSPYTLSKEQNINLLLQYSKWEDLNFAIVYFYNAFGPNEISTGKYSTVIAKYLNIIANGISVLPVTSPGTQRRNFTHVYDIVSGLRYVADKGYGDGYGIGSDFSYSIVEVVEMLGATSKMQPNVPGNRMNAPMKSKKTKALGWKPNYNLKDYLEKYRIH